MWWKNTDLIQNILQPPPAVPPTSSPSQAADGVQVAPECQEAAVGGAGEARGGVQGAWDACGEEGEDWEVGPDVEVLAQRRLEMASFQGT